jgi:glycosyltransferase involved in cell wall biosynthesis
MKILFIDESKIFGGHEIMFLGHLSGVLQNSSHNVIMLVDQSNMELCEALEKLSGEYQQCSFETRLFSSFKVRPLSNLFCLSDILFLRRKIKMFCPDVCMVVQGTIEIGSLSLLVSRMLGFKTLSYLPITKKSKHLSVLLGGVRDYINKKIYYRLPHEIITISNFNQQELLNNFNVPKSKSSIVYNYTEALSTQEIPILKKSEVFNFALIGRIDNVQKCQHAFLSKIINSNMLSNIVFHVIGDNDSVESIALRKLCSGANNVKFHGWCGASEVTRLLNTMDGVVMPSSFEGVPLVMIDAINSNKVVFASAIDGMLEFLPKEFLFECGDYTAAIALLTDYVENSPRYLELLLKTKEHFKVFNKEQGQQIFLQRLNFHLDKINNGQ